MFKNEVVDMKKKEVTEKRPLGLYVHIPFCVKKCDYCDFLSFAAEDATKERYVEALCEEIRANAENAGEYLVETVYFGGGTPSVLSVAQMEKILKAISDTFEIRGMVQEKVEKKRRFGKKKVEEPEKAETPAERMRRVLNGELAEITVEVNPGTADAQKLQALYELGFNRLSMGLQSAVESELSCLGRIHTKEQFAECVKAAREAGFRNISGDLMSGLPRQTVESLTESIRFLLAQQPEHISVYSLQIEDGTPFSERYGENGPERSQLPDEDTERLMYEVTGKLLEEAGYERYEISNYAKTGFESRHNSSYWKGTEYLGFGLGASSLMSNARFHNTTEMEEYLAGAAELFPIREDIERLVQKEQMEEFMFLGLRMCRGIEKAEFKRRFKCEIETVYGDVMKRLTAQGVLAEAEGRVYLTPRGIDVSNVVLAEFLLDEFVRR
ncbi:MAG: radical SAM family heme chaperone HemW [Lachnospiraceae bacterium]|nr:radical SAM family heme chaperone HemW [Lachnospiraceae bacterium]